MPFCCLYSGPTRRICTNAEVKHHSRSCKIAHTAHAVMACSLQTLLPELLCLIYQSCDSFEQAAGLASTCRHAQRVWQINQYGIIKHIIRHRTYAWHAAQDLARLQVKLDQALGAPLPADYAMVVIPAPACLPRLDRHLFGNHEYATAACRAFQVQWSYQRSRGPEREVLKLRTSEVERFHAAFYMRVAFVVANYDALPSPSHPMRLHNPGLKRLQLPLVELWALVEMTQVFELPGLCK